MVGDFDDVLNSGKEVSLSRWWTNLEFLLGEVRRDEGAKTKRVKWKSNEPEDKAAFALPRNHQLLLVHHWRRLGCWIFIHSTSQNLCHMPYVICNMSYIDIYKYSALKPCMKTSWFDEYPLPDPTRTFFCYPNPTRTIFHNLRV